MAFNLTKICVAFNSFLGTISEVDSKHLRAIVIVKGYLSALKKFAIAQVV